MSQNSQQLVKQESQISNSLVTQNSQVQSSLQNSQINQNQSQQLNRQNIQNNNMRGNESNLQELINTTDIYLKETYTLNQFIQGELIYLRVDLEKVQVLCCENLVKNLQKLNRYKDTNISEQQQKQIDKKIQQMRDVLQQSHASMLNHHYAGHIVLLQNYTYDYFKAFQDIDNEQQNMLGLIYNNSQRPNLYINRVNQKIPLSNFAYEQLFDYLKSQKIIKTQEFLKTILVPKSKTSSTLEDINPQLSKKALDILSERDKGVDQFLMNKKVKLDLTRNWKELNFWRKLTKAIGQKGQQSLLFKQAWDYQQNDLQSNMVMDSDEKTFEQKNNLPTIKAKDYINLVQSFLDRKLVDENNRPNIINVKIDDYNNEITILKLSQRGTLLLAGTKSGAVLHFNLIQLQPSDEQNNDHSKQNMFLQPEIDQNQKLEPETTFSYMHKFIGHTGSITAISILYDEQYFLSASVDNIIRLWCIKSKQCLLTYKIHLKTIWDLEFAQAGYFFLSASADKTAVLWTTDKLSPQYIFSGHQSDVVFAKFSPNSNYVYTGSLDFKIRIFRGLTDENFGKDDQEKYAECLKIFIIDFHITSACLSFDGGFLALGGLHGEVQVLDLMKQEFYEKLFFQKPEDRCQIVDLKFNMDQSELSVASLQTFVTYSFKNILSEGCIKVYDQYYTNKQQFEENKIKQRFGQKLPLDVFEIDSKKKESFNILSYNPKNFIILVLK